MEIALADFGLIGSPETSAKSMPFRIRHRPRLPTAPRPTSVSCWFAAGFTKHAVKTTRSKPYDSWIIIGGTLVDPKDDSFILDYGENVIKVEVHDWDSYAEASALMNGDKLTVYG